MNNQFTTFLRKKNPKDDNFTHWLLMPNSTKLGHRKKSGKKNSNAKIQFTLHRFYNTAFHKETKIQSSS